MPKRMTVLTVSTFAFTVCFAVWMMLDVMGIPIRAEFRLDATKFGLLMATPVLTGALFRLPLSIWPDRFDGRIIMLLLVSTCPLVIRRP